ncbi:hypothetical protein RclHR1_00040026 [Rhizophagus clarus]|uniref:Uncharacterized protein n=1 Tax=Rhizophagus clarus TaxID=94130 RepID=A0A2Z6RRM2_9GLOM|nr:hypothetical protein RclHR1_00040026 [Rhizophagus clarus]GES91723.1 hypothetical protein RCL_jg13963.t1 [Rhizophagus clarus]
MKSCFQIAKKKHIEAFHGYELLNTSNNSKGISAISTLVSVHAMNRVTLLNSDDELGDHNPKNLCFRIHYFYITRQSTRLNQGSDTTKSDVNKDGGYIRWKLIIKHLLEVPQKL